MAIEYDDITDADKLEISDMLSKVSSIDALREEINTDRETGEETWRSQDAELQTEKARLNNLIKGKRQARITGNHGA